MLTSSACTKVPDDSQISEAEVLFPQVQDLPEQKNLPDPFMGPDGKRIEHPSQWEQQREYLKSMLAHYMYGHMPPRPSKDQYSVNQTHSEMVFGDTAVNENYTITVSRQGKSVDLAIALIRPVEKKRYPSIIKNCRVLFDAEDVPKRFESIAELDLTAARETVRRGYLFCKFRREDFAPDHKDNRDLGVFPLYPEYDWGSIAVWAWTHQLVLDVLNDLEYANMDQIIYTGHSRGAQTAIAAGIFDERADLVIPNTGGYGSCGTLRVRDPEGVRGTMDYIEHLSNKVPHWFGKHYYEFAGHQNRMPFDAHTLVALVAPRPLLNTNATEDQNNNTLAIEAGIRTGKRVYDWMGLGNHCRLHWRSGLHAQQDEDWKALLDFSDEILFKRKGTSKFNHWVYPDFDPELDWAAP